MSFAPLLILILNLIVAEPPAATASESTAPLVIPPNPDGLTEVVVDFVDVDGGWIEVTHLSTEAEPVLIDVGRRRSSDPPLILHPSLPAGPVLLCSGGRGYGVACAEHYRGDVELGAAPAVFVDFLDGMAVRGTYRLGFEPVAGARVAVVPAGLEAFRPLTLPLEVREGRLKREVTTDDEGHFKIPGLASDDYFLETILPSGRVHRSDPFTVPERTAVERHFLARFDQEVYFDLETIDVAEGLAVEIWVLGIDGEPIQGAAVTASQGRTVDELLSFEATSGSDGRVGLDGLTVEMSVRLGCRKDRFKPWQEEFELLPVSIECILEPWALVRADVLGPDSQPVPGARVTVRALAEDAPEPTTVAADSGGFTVGELAAGDYKLRAAAPGFQADRRAFTLEPGDELELPAIFLLAGRGVEGLVVDAETGEPLAAVEVEAVEPPGSADDMTDLDGTFQLTEPGEGEALTVRFSTPDYAAVEVTFDAVELAAEEGVLVEMQPAGWILAVVEDADGVPCQGCRVVIWPDGEELVTDGFGEAVSGPLEPGTYRVARPRVTHLGSTVVEQGDATVRYARVTAKKATLVRLREAERTVTVRFEPRLEDLWRLSARSPRRTEKYFPEDDGSYRVGLREDEDLELYLHTWDPVAEAEIMIWQGTLSRSHRGEKLRLRLSGAEVRGRARGSGGAALVKVPVRFRRFTDGVLNALVYTDEEGRFELPHVRPGVYTVLIGNWTVQFASVAERQKLDLGTFDLFLFNQPPSQSGDRIGPKR